MAAGRLIAASASALAAGLAAGAWAARNLKTYDWAMARTRRAGFTEHDVLLNGSKLHYAQGPAGGKPPLLLIHGQAVDWHSYARVLPDLARDFTVYAVDVHGHGLSERTPEKYTAAAIGADLAGFVEEVIGSRAVVSGHSSGGQLAAWLAGHRPGLVRAVVLEDPPLFTTLLPRARKTWNWVDLANACHTYLESGESDWGAFLFAHQKLWDFFGGGAHRIVRSGLARRAKHPDRPITVFFMPPGWNDMQRAIEHYDPRFGDAFHTGAWDEGFDHEATLRKIEAPAILIHANWKYGDDGVLQGAIDADDARRIASLISDVQLVRVDSGHNVHGEKPARFTEIVRSATARPR
ncbi:alpha/beta fold hydrolase [Amycolatopsis sp. NPDC054798]